MASAVSEYNEYDEIGEAAKNGIVLDHGHNFMRDYLFGGNEKIYRKAMFVNDTITSMALLSGGVMNVASNSANASQFVRGVTKEIVTPIVACKATDSGIDLAADKLGMNEYLRDGLKLAVDTYMTYKISQAGKTGNSNPEVVELIEGNVGKAVEGVSDPRYIKEGYKSGPRSNKLLLKDNAKKTINVTDWSRSFNKADIANERRLFLGEDCVKIAPGKWRS